METLRIYPPLTSFFREAPKGGVVLGGYHIPEKSLVAVRCCCVSYTINKLIFFNRW